MFGSVKPSPAALIRAAFNLFESVVYSPPKEKDHPLGGLSFGGHILVKFELRNASISFSVNVSVPSL